MSRPRLISQEIDLTVGRVVYYEAAALVYGQLPKRFQFTFNSFQVFFDKSYQCGTSNNIPRGEDFKPRQVKHRKELVPAIVEMFQTRFLYVVGKISAAERYRSFKSSSSEMVPSSARITASQNIESEDRFFKNALFCVETDRVVSLFLRWEREIHIVLVCDTNALF